MSRNLITPDAALQTWEPLTPDLKTLGWFGEAGLGQATGCHSTWCHLLKAYSPTAFQVPQANAEQVSKTWIKMGMIKL